MKKFIVALMVLGSLNIAFGQSQRNVSEASFGTTISPLVTAALLMDTMTITTISPFATTSADIQNRGVAGREQLKDEMVKLNDDMIKGQVRTVKEVRQPALKELFVEIANNEDHMAEIDAVINNGTELDRIATAVAITLFVH